VPLTSDNKEYPMNLRNCLTCTPDTPGPFGKMRKRGKTRHVSGVCSICRLAGVKAGWSDGQRIVTVPLEINYKGRAA
jgi:hypothetical protein